MADRGIDGLHALAEEDPALAPLALTEAHALAAAADPIWQAVTVDFSPSADAPLLAGASLAVPFTAVRGLLGGLLADPALAALGLPAAAPALPTDDATLTRWVAAAVSEDEATLGALLRPWGDAWESVAALLRLAVLPGLQAAGRLALPLLARAPWEHGYCPVCAAWPTLAELRGAERLRRLRCGRCATGWQFAAGRCPFCANADAHALRYLAEGEDATARVEVCERCRGYLKVVLVPGRLSPGEILLHDLETLDLDTAVAEEGYQRPDGLGAPLAVAIRSVV